MPRLFRRRAVWLPTWWGLFWLGLLVAGLIVFVATRANQFLAVTAPAQGARLLVVEGWPAEQELARAAQHARQGGYTQVVASGGPIPSWSSHQSYAQRAAQYLQAQLPQGPPVSAAPSAATKQDRTYASAMAVRDWAAARGLQVNALDVVTVGVHARRSRLLYEKAFGPGVAVGVIALRPQDDDEGRWWTSSQAFKAMLGEALSLGWTYCCFWPGPRGSHEERWALPGASAASR